MCGVDLACSSLLTGLQSGKQANACMCHEDACCNKTPAIPLWMLDSQHQGKAKQVVVTSCKLPVKKTERIHEAV
jgi:hypothetical protein